LAVFLKQPWSGFLVLGQWMIALLFWSLLVDNLDNVLRPILIKKGADLPWLLILAGVHRPLSF